MSMSVTTQPQTQTPPITKPQTLHPLTSADVKPTQKNNNELLWSSLAGLAVISGGSLYWYKTKQPENKYKPPKENLKEKYKILQEDTDHLKNLVIKDYQAKVQVLRNKANIFDEFDIEIPFENGKDLHAKILEMETQNPKLEEERNKLIKENLSIIREKFKRLSTDPQWKEFRQIRKQLKHASKFSNTADESTLAIKKIELIDDLIINKVYPENVPQYESAIGLTQQQVLDIIKKDYSSLQEYLDDFQSKSNPKTPVLWPQEILNTTDTLSLQLVFPREVELIDECRKDNKFAVQKLDAAKNFLKKYHESLRKLSVKYAETPDMIELKKKMAELRTLKRKLASTKIH